MSQRSIELSASAVQSASGNSAAVHVPTITMADITLDITAKTGTSPTLELWLQASHQEAGPWFDVPYDQQLTHTGTGTDTTANTNKRNINGTSAANDVSQHMARYKHLPAAYYRIAWAIGGTAGPTFTFSARMEAK